ncbi:MAG: aspartate aminotransferase family protein [Candidatus Omnitrophica bacterium]|nr:aspartate aminotransferase family protein [Candidatus Omnitrophota bacterium]
MGKEFPLIPKKVKKVETKYRKIITDIPVPESIPILEKLREYEPISMSGQPPIIWDKAIGINVYDKYGNMWLDFSSGVLVANAGHGNKFVIEEIKKQIEKPLLHNYCFPSEIRAELVEKIASLSPEPLKKVFLLTTGAEAIECAIKLARTYGKSKNKKVIISFEGSFHGRTLGAQMIGGIPNLKEWIVNPDPDIIQVPFPGDPRCKDKSFDLFLKTIKEKNINEKDVCAIISETYQGGNASLMPLDYAKQLREWCDKNEILLIFDEIQAGFGRTGTFWGFQHYGIIPDLFVLGKGISSSLPISAVVGRKEILDQYEPGTMTSTHTGNPLCCAAALGSINYIEKYRLWENAKKMGEIFEKKLSELKKYNCVGFVCGKGLVWGLHIVKNATEPDPNTAFKIVEKSFEKGLLFFAPVGYKSATIKVNPPLIINEEAIIEGCDVIKEAIEEVLIG